MTPPDQRSNAGGKLAKREWFRQIIVRPGIKALHPIFHPRSLRKNKHREIGLLQA